MNQSSELMRLTASGTLWISFTHMVSKGFVFLTNIILARILLPEDFGLLALALIAISYIDSFSELGVGSAVIYHQKDKEQTANVAFLISLISGISLTIISFFLSKPVAIFFNDPRVVPLIQALSLTLLLSSLGSIHASLLKRELEFKRRFIPETARALAKGGVSILLALLGYGVWSLVWGQIVGVFITTLLYWWVTRWFPKPYFDFQKARLLVNYGFQLVLVTLLGQLIMNMDYLFIGRRLDANQLGYYTMAFRVPELIVLNICYIVSQAIFPAYAKLQDDLAALRQGFLTTVRYVSLITLPAGIGLLIIAPEFVHVFYTDRWAPAIPALRWLAIYAIVYSLSFNVGDIYKATGRPALLNQISVFRIALTVPILWYASGINIVYVAAGLVAITIVLTIVQLVIVNSILKSTFQEFYEAIKPIITGGLIMSLVCFVISYLISAFEPLFRLLILIVSGMTVYGLTLRVTCPELVIATIGFFTSHKQKSAFQKPEL